VYGLIHGVLQQLSQWTGSYGWAIIALTVGVRLLLMPLQVWQQRSGRESAALQAQAQEIQQKYTGEEQQKRLGHLYRQSGGKLLAGCLPALAQWPVFLAMYGALNTFPFALPAGFFWLENLGAPDPYFILPLLAVATSVWQTWATVPKQQRLSMMLLPAIFFFVMMKASAGVVLYWVVSNAVSLVQHYLLTARRPAAAGA
jgi:YidC/Oxa1 family membrane protein insertase